uniref:Ankyrin repeat domain 2 (stretch responsive muscle) n=1 Tax=Cyprinus carpio TaxID=7962 RepID=A0A8C2DU71_CYPCA
IFSLMIMDENILWATAVVDSRAALDKREEVQSLHCVLYAQRLNQSVMKRSEFLMQAEEQVRKISSDLRREIVDLGGAENIIELRMKKKIRNNTAAPKDPMDVPVDEFLEAAAQGKMEVVEKFLEDGGDPNICDEFRKTALHRAALENHTKIVEKLLDKGADINFKDRLDCRAVHWACRGGSLSALKVLQDRGADINVRDKEGDTALHDAVRLNRYKIVKLLILAGADMQIKKCCKYRPVKQWQFDTKETLEKLEQMREVGLA